MDGASPWTFLGGVLGEMIGSSPLEQVAALLALAYLVLAMRRSLWCWACALVSSLLYLLIMVRARLAMQALLQAFYVVMALYGYWQWRRGRDQQGQITPRRWPLAMHGRMVVLIAVLTFSNGVVSSRQGIPAPYLDAFVAWGSVVTTWMVARQLIENWLYWVIIDLAAVWLYYSQGLRPTALLFLIYVGMVIRGWFVWRRSLRPL